MTLLKLVLGFVALTLIQAFVLGGLASISPAIIVPAILLLFLLVPESPSKR